LGQQNTIVGGIVIDDSDFSENPWYLLDLTAKQWVDGVQNVLRTLYRENPCQTSTAILDGITRSGQTVTIVPTSKRKVMDFGTNATTNPIDGPAAAAPGKPTEDGKPGVGGGSPSTIGFVPQDWDLGDAALQSLKPVDEVLLHELVHALRMALGQEDLSSLPPPVPSMGLRDASEEDLKQCKFTPTPTTQLYQHIEEFAAILITNVYRSECRRIGLVRDHLPPLARRGEPQPALQCLVPDPNWITRSLGYPLTNPRNFLTFWRPQIEGLWTDLSVNGVISRIAAVQCSFNPFRELMLERTRPPAASYAH
jgi:hypothetical protein